MEIDQKYGNGVLNATPAFQEVLNAPCAGATIRCEVPAGTYKLDTSPVAGSGKVIWNLHSGVTFTGSGTLPFVTPTKYQGAHKGHGFNSTVVGGSVERIVSKLTPEDSVFMLSTENYGGSTIFPEDAVLLHAKATNSNECPRAWTQNTNIVKQSTATNNYSCGMEVSVQNQTSETGLPNASGCIQGVFVSYIHHDSGSNYGSAAYVVGGNGASASYGWKYGMWIDNIATGGTAITVKNSSGNAMDSALDTRSVTGAFGTGAVTLGNNHKIAAKDQTGVMRNVATLDSGGYLQISESAVPVVINGPMLISNANIATTAGAPTGKYLVWAINGVNYKIALLAM